MTKVNEIYKRVPRKDWKNSKNIINGKGFKFTRENLTKEGFSGSDNKRITFSDETLNFINWLKVFV